MHWDLVAISFGVWVFFGAHFIFAGRITQMTEAGLLAPGAADTMLGLSKALCSLALLNLLVFFFVFGWKVSWLWAALVVFGGYAASALYVLLTRGSVYDSFLNPTHKMGWVGLPVLSLAVWLVAFRA